MTGSLFLLSWLAVTSRALLTDVRRHAGWALARVTATVPGSLPYLAAGISLLVHGGGGLAWVAVGVIGALVGSVANAWILLVEILR